MKLRERAYLCLILSLSLSLLSPPLVRVTLSVLQMEQHRCGVLRVEAQLADIEINHLLLFTLRVIVELPLFPCFLDRLELDFGQLGEIVAQTLWK